MCLPHVFIPGEPAAYSRKDGDHDVPCSCLSVGIFSWFDMAVSDGTTAGTAEISTKKA